MKLPEMSNTRRRVKLYVLNDERQWDDHGTGHVSSMYVDHEKMQGIVLLVRSEDDGKKMGLYIAKYVREHVIDEREAFVVCNCTLDQLKRHGDVH